MDISALPPWARSTYGLSFLFACIALIIGFVLSQTRKSSKAKSGNTILFLGPSDAGKTAIVARLTYGQFLPTHTSLQMNETIMSRTEDPKARPLMLVDIPGHPRIRAQFVDVLSRAKGIVFVVDTSTIARNGAAVAEHLHSVLNAISHLPPSAHTPPLLILANKSDLISAGSTGSSRESLASERVRTILERELEKRRQSSLTGVGVGGLGDDAGDAQGEGAISGGLETLGDGPFSFAKWEGGDVSLRGGFVDRGLSEKSEKSEGSGLDSVLEWLDSL